jgi:hypothetical protein
MIKNILSAMHTDIGKYAISIILGFGLSSLFRKVCNERNCIVFHAPALDEVTKNTYSYGNKCYKFKEKAMKCGSAEREISFA